MSESKYTIFTMETDGKVVGRYMHRNDIGILFMCLSPPDLGAEGISE